MEELNIFEFAISNVSFVENDEGIMIFMYSSFEVNTDDVMFFLNEDNNLLIHYPSDNLITIKIENDIIYRKLKETTNLKVFEIDSVSGEVLNYYNAKK